MPGACTGVLWHADTMSFHTLSLQSTSTRPLFNSSFSRARFPLLAAQNAALASGVSFCKSGNKQGLKIDVRDHGCFCAQTTPSQRESFPMRHDHCKNALQYIELQCFIYNLWPKAVSRAALPRTTTRASPPIKALTSCLCWVFVHSFLLT